VSVDGGQAKLQFARDASRRRATAFCTDHELVRKLSTGQRRTRRSTTYTASRTAERVTSRDIAHARRYYGRDDQRILALYGYA
jgi:hypothetical protein